MGDSSPILSLNQSETKADNYASYPRSCEINTVTPGARFVDCPPTVAENKEKGKYLVAPTAINKHKNLYGKKTITKKKQNNKKNNNNNNKNIKQKTRNRQRYYYGVQTEF